MATDQVGFDPADVVETARRAAEACRGLGTRDMAERLAADGLLGILADEAVGGLGLPLSFASRVVEAAAASLVRFPLAETILLARALETVSPDLALALVEGRAIGTIAWRSSGELLEGQDGALLLSGHAAAPLAHEAEWLLVPLTDSRGVLVEVGAAGLTRADPGDFDVVLPDCVAIFDGVEIERERIIAREIIDTLEADVLVLRAAAILGASEHCLELARDYAMTRHQFGKPLTANQAIRHSLARQKLVLEGMRSLLRRAAAPAAGDSELVRRAVFTFATQSGAAIAEGAIQVFGGMGFTWDVPLHLHLRRIRSLAVQGDAPENAEQLAAAFLGTIEPAPCLDAR